MASPLLKAVRQGFPHSRLVFLTFDSTAALARRQNLTDEVRVIRTTGLADFAVDVVRQVMRFQAEHIDVVLDLEFFSKFSTMMSILTRSPVRVGYYLETFWRDSIITHPVFFNYHQHVLDIYESTLRSIGLSMAERGVGALPTTAAEREAAAAFLTAHGIDDGDVLLGVNPNASDLSFERRWPAAHFVDVIDRLLARAPVKVMFTGGPADAAYVESIAAQLQPRWPGRVVNACGRLGFPEFVAALSRCGAFLTGDSGPMHVAVAQGVPTISLWGPTNPNFHAPPEGKCRIVYKQLPCSPCLPMLTSRPGMWCGHRADCMHSIGVDEVLAAVEASLREAHGGPLARPTAVAGTA
jgi:ADP-heptose:LPS heptosyltransferase